MKSSSSQPVYIVFISRTARKQLLQLPKPATDRLQQVIDGLVANPRPFGAEKLTARDEYRIRVGNYRVLYTIADAVLTVEVVKVGQRGNFYDR